MRVCVNASHTALLFLALPVYTIVRQLYGHRLSGYSNFGHIIPLSRY